MNIIKKIKDLYVTRSCVEQMLTTHNTVNRFLFKYYSKHKNNSNVNYYVSYYYPTLGNIYNVGDYIQTIATEKAILSCCNERCSFVHVQRNQLIEHSGGTCIMNGWYEHDDLGFLPGDDTRAIWIGTHFNETICNCLSLLFKSSSYRLYDVGCRDKTTLEFCRQHKIPSYFSRCLTLTLPRRTTEETLNADTVYIVDCPNKILALLPKAIRDVAKIIYQRKHVREPWQPWQTCRETAERLLDEYRQHARLVVTSALHCAQPCIAMGIPVVFINPGYKERCRFSSMDGLIPQYTKKDLKNGKIDFNPIAPDIEELKVAMLTNLYLTLKEKRSPEENKELSNVRKIIGEFNLI